MAEFLLLRDLPRYECLQRRAQRYAELDITAVETTLSLLRVASDMMEAFTAHFERNDITQSRFITLMLVEQFDSVGETLLPSAIADMLGVTRATVTGLLDGLERDTLIERRQHGDDRRALTLHLTPHGWSYLEGMLPDHYRRVAGLMGHLSHDEQRQLVGLLSKVAEGLDALQEANWKPDAGEPDESGKPGATSALQANEAAEELVEERGEPAISI